LYHDARIHERQEDNMNRAFCKLWESLKEREHLEDLSIDGEKLSK
jgi:hypothetical protein